MKRVNDDNFLCDTGDILDNAVWNLLVGCMECWPTEKLQSCVLDVLNALGRINRFDENANEFVSDYPWDFNRIYDDILGCAVRAVQRSPLVKNCGAYQWNMAIIGPTELDIEVAMARHNLMTCHPWEDDFGYICYSCRERCKYCSKAYVTAYKNYLK